MPDQLLFPAEIFRAACKAIAVAQEADDVEWKIDETGKLIDPKKIDSTTQMTTINPSGKNTHTYVDEPISGILVDYKGHAAPYEEKSFVHLESAQYNLSLASEYIEFIRMAQTIYS